MDVYEAYGRRNSWINMYVTSGAMKVHGSVSQALSRVPAGVAHVMAQHIKARGLRGELAGQFGAPYRSTSRRKFALSADYDAKGRGLDVPASNAIVYESSAALHASTTRNSYAPTGGMWRGITVVVGSWMAKVAFRGRSIGQEVRWHTYKSGKRLGQKVSKTARIANPVKVSNAKKAWSVVSTKGVNLLALTRDELRGLADGLVAAYTGPRGILPNVRWGIRPHLGQMAVRVARALR